MEIVFLFKYQILFHTKLKTKSFETKYPHKIVISSFFSHELELKVLVLIRNPSGK